MPNDAISREAAKVKEDLLRVICNEALDALADGEVSRHDDLMWAYGVVANSPIEELSASLPADTRWEEMRSHLRGYRQVALAVHDEAYVTAIDHALASMDELDRLALAPAEAEDVPKRPPMLLASIGDCSRDVWWTRQGEDLWESQRIFGVATHSSSAGLLVSRDHSDPEALRLYLEDMAEAQG